MNLVEVYLEEVYSVREYIPSWAESTDKPFVIVNAKWSCYGSESVEERIFDSQSWENLKKNGYYLG